MKRSILILLALFLLVFSTSWAQCPEDPNDRGDCDTMYVEPWLTDTIQAGAGPYWIHVPIYVTHDVPDPNFDSLSNFVIPLCYTHTNPSKYCSVSGYWNDTHFYPFPYLEHSVFRHLTISEGDTVINRMMRMSEALQSQEWNTIFLNLDGTSHFWLGMLATGTEDQQWWEGSKVLLATMTFVLEDSMQICMDTCFWPPESGLTWTTADAINFVPRLGTPHDPGSYKMCFNVHIASLPTANFSAEPDSGFVPLTVEFSDLSSGFPTSWLWDFGDDSTSTEQNPQHVYRSTGTYYPKLIVSNQLGADTLISPNPIAVLETLTVDFDAEPTHGKEPLIASFQSLCNLTPHNVTWYFGDEQTSDDLNPVHEYAEVGSYDVKLVAELFGYQDSLIREDYIWVSDIQAEFTADPRCGPAPLTVEFGDNSTGSYPATEWHWDFDDGGTSALQDPTHNFQNTGSFDIILIVSDGIGVDTLIKPGYISTQDSLKADFIGLPKSGKPPLTVVFEPVLGGIANQYHWDFGDGDTSNLPNPIHIYTTQGKYDVKLVARLELGECSQIDSLIKDDYVVVNYLEAQFSADPTAGLAPLSVQFTDESSGDPDIWFWDFGDGNTSMDRDPSHQYDTAGIYDVFLRVSNSIADDSLFKLSYILVDTSYTDLSAETYDPGGARPGFDLRFYYVWTNVGTNPAENCTIRILLPPEMTFYDLNPVEIRTGTYSGYSFSGDTIVVPLETIDPSIWYGGNVEVYGNIPETVSSGDTLVSQMWLSTTTIDQNSTDNYMQHELEVTGSIDPNDKGAYPGGNELSYSVDLGRRLTYTIHYENVYENKKDAKAAVVFLRVVDTLGLNLSWGSFAPGASSHPDKCGWEFDPYTGVITWFCDSIMLPPNQNPPEGEGYFTFSISPQAGLPNGTEIDNTAWIRFDHNAWIQAPQEGTVTRTIKYPYINGDANGDEDINVSDVVYLITYLFKGGPPPDPLEAGDVNCDLGVDVADVVYLISYLFRFGPPPPDC